ncbi:esterase-like activity of phytase family protein [Vibrio salinus]|uniref:esterase-like activity of phytase family protein n=1 Tax=Vibrio salinus TaxID=2899784 RepID=UPI001E4DE4AF|nr:esterase-like activity of phytase family protein [Vibrio salinus]MCE0495832.1 esterase-like activity of phytase family protein [Vibrio salinus]
MKTTGILKTLFFTSLISLNAQAAELTAHEFTIPLDTFNTPHALNLSVGVGSGAYHRPGDPDNVIYTITDRGPNIPCKKAEKLIGEKLCAKGKIFPDPNFSPSIYKLKVTDNGVKILQRIQIKTSKKISVTGISTPETESAFNLKGQKLFDDPNGVDSEALVRTKRGDFYISDEYGPSILHLSADGTVIERWIPEGTQPRFAGANYPVRARLPSILAKRHLNRGIESISLSPDEQFLYFAMQSPLDNPDVSTYKTSRNIRLFKVKRTSGAIIGEYIYHLDTPETFRKDNEKKARKQSDVKISDMVSNGQDKLIVLERISKTTKFYQIDLKSGIKIARKWDNTSTSPSLEQEETLPVLKKALILTTDNIDNAPDKIEGVAYVNPKLWYLTNDNDFGIEGQPSYVVKVEF